MTAAIDPKVVPDEIADERCQNRHKNGEAQIHLTGPGKGAGGQQKGDGRQGQSYLFGQHNQKEHGRSMLYEKSDPVLHVAPPLRLSSPFHTIPLGQRDSSSGNFAR